MNRKQAKTAGRIRRDLWVSAALFVSTCAIYAGVLDAGFVNYDDDLYVSRNPYVLAGLTHESTTWALSACACANWHPLTWWSLQLDCELFGARPAAFHCTNVMLHAVNSVLLFWVLRLTTAAIGRSACVAAFFALHPQHVESVAWIAERKDVLSALFWMLTVLAYVYYSARPTWRRYFAVLVALSLGLMAKPMLVTLPCVLLLLDYWPLRRWTAASSHVPKMVSTFVPSRRWATPAWLLIEKAPFLLLSVVSSITTLLVQSHAGAVRTTTHISIVARLANAAHAYVTYAWKTLWPLDLAVFYPHPREINLLWHAASGIPLLGISWLVYRVSRGRPYALVGWWLYIGVLFPVIGLIQVGDQALADRYMYLPMVGMLIVLVWGIDDLSRFWNASPRTISLAAGGLLLVCTAATWQQIGYWHDSVTLWQHAIAVTEPNAVSFNSLGVALLEEGHPDDAIDWLRQATELSPGDERAWQNLALALAQLRRTAESADAFRAVHRINPLSSLATYNLGVLAEAEGNLDEAVAYYRAAVCLKADYLQAHVRLARLLEKPGVDEKRRGPKSGAVAEATNGPG